MMKKFLLISVLHLAVVHQKNIYYDSCLKTRYQGIFVVHTFAPYSQDEFLLC